MCTEDDFTYISEHQNYIVYNFTLTYTLNLYAFSYILTLTDTDYTKTGNRNTLCVPPFKTAEQS